jgi:hypothetical protein
VSLKKILIGGIAIVLCLTVILVFSKKYHAQQQLRLLSTEQVLREVYNADDAYISKFIDIAENTTITLDPFLLGKEYATTPYTLEERELIVTTLKFLVAQQFGVMKPSDDKYYTASAGAPGAGKTFALEKLYDIDVAKGEFYSNAIYIGPDSVVLPQMQAYKTDCAAPNIGPLKAYEKWRAASNFIANFMMVKAITDGLNIIHDTTSTNVKTAKILDALGQEGYVRRLHFFIADKDARENALQHRKQKLGYTVELQLTPATSKAEAAYERLVDGTYKGRVEVIVFYVQEGDFYLGTGKTNAFAIYNPRASEHIQFLSKGHEYVNHILQQVDAKEGLKPELQKQVHEFVKTWVNSSEVNNSNFVL